MKTLTRLFAVAVCTALLGSAGLVQAAPVAIEGLFNTGVDDSGKTIAAREELHFNVFNPDTGEVRDVIPVNNQLPFLPRNDDKSGWILGSNSDSLINSDVYFRQEFDLNGFDLSTIHLSGLWMINDFSLDILVNGMSISQTQCGKNVFCQFDLNEGFVEGKNTIDFVLRGAENGIGLLRIADFIGSGELGSPSPGPGPAPVPEPASGALLLMGLGLIAATTRRKCSR